MEQTHWTLKSYAKLNLCLWVYSPLPSNPSFHPICGIFQTISLHDTITVRPLREKLCRILCDSLEIPLDENNDIAKAYSKLKDRLGFGIEVTLVKCVPVGAGLAGGSSNAAAILQMLNQFCDPKYTYCELKNICMQIGSDVSYFLHGGTCLVSTGVGLTIEPLKEMATTWFFLIYPNTKASTASVFQAFGQNCRRRDRHLGDSFPNLENNFGQNDLQTTTFKLYPAVEKLHGELSRIGLTEIYMTGSGSTLYIPVNGEIEGERLKAIVNKELTDVWTSVTHTQPFPYQLDGSIKKNSLILF